MQLVYLVDKVRLLGVDRNLSRGLCLSHRMELFLSEILLYLTFRVSSDLVFLVGSGMLARYRRLSWLRYDLWFA